jgi:uncharacterized protein involved in exopolysaccharide biosynthesis
MPDVAIVRTPGTTADGDELSLWALGIVLLRHRLLIAGLALLGGGLAFALARSKPLVYASTATFIPQASQTQMSGIAALAASQFGVTLPSSNAGNWGPSTYLELLRSRELLDPITRDTVVVAERGNRAIPVIELLEVKAPSEGLRVEAAAGRLRGMIVASESKTVGGVKVRVSTPWPSVSLWLTNRVLRGVNQFNIQTRKSQSVEEIQFVTAQAVEAERALGVAEYRLQSFLQGNREFSSPQLTFERDRLQRDVSLRRELQMSWLKSREDARVRAVRENPVITVFESPRLALHPESRHALLHAVLGIIVGGTIGVILAFLSHVLRAARRANGADARHFFDLMEQSKPRFLRRAAR